jgi:hypothetical protein
MSTDDTTSKPQQAAGAEQKEAEEKQKDAKPQAAAPKTRGKWRRRFVRTLLALVALALVFRLALAILLPTVIHKTARQLGFDLSYRRLDLNLIGTQAGIWDVVLRPKDGSGEILRNEYAFANISSLALFKLKLVAYRLEADGVSVNVVRNEDGSVPLIDQLNAAFASSTPKPSKPLRFESPLTVEAVRLHHVKVDVTDRSVSPPFHDTLTMDLRVSDLGGAGGPVTLDVEVFTKSMLQALRVQGDATLAGDAMNASVTFGLYGLRLHDAQAYLASLGVRSSEVPVSLTGVADVALKLTPGQQAAMNGTAAVRDVRLLGGADEAVALKQAQVQIAELSPSRLHVSKVAAQGGLLRLTRTPEGLITFATLSPSPATQPATAPAMTAPALATAPPATAPAGTPFNWRLDELVATDLRGEFRDQLAAPERKFEAAVRSFEVRNLAATGKPDDVATLKLAMAVPNVAADVKIEGRATPFADAPGATIVFDATGVRPDAIRPYLRPLGIEPTLAAGTFHATLEASAKDLTGESPQLAFALNDVRLDDGGAGLLRMDSVRVMGLKRDPASGAIEVAQIAATGPTLTVRRLDEQTIEVPGVRYRRASSPRAAVTAAAPGSAGASPSQGADSGRPPLPVVRIGKLTWGGANVRLEDRSTAGTEPIDLSDAQLELSGFVLDLRPDAPPAQPGKITGRFKSPGLAEAVTLDGTLTPGAGSMAADVTVGGTGLDLRRLAPYLKPLGIEPWLARGALKAAARATIAQSDQALRLAADVHDVELSDGDARLLALEKLGVDRVEISAAGYDVGDVTVSKPFARVERDADGGLIAAGVKLLTAAPSTRPSTRPAVAAAPATQSTQPAAAPDPFTVLAALPPVSLKSLKLDGAEVDWVDRVAAKPVELKLIAGATVQSLALNRGKPLDAQYELVLSSPTLAEKLRVAGAVQSQPDSISLTADVEASGLRPQGVAGYLPPGVEPAMKSGSFKTTARATLARHPDGGLRGEFNVDALALRDGAADAPPLAALQAVQVALDRLDLATGDAAVSKIAISGIEASAVRDVSGAIEVGGLRFTPAAPPTGAAAPEAAAAPAAPMAATPADLQAIVTQSKQAMPLFAAESIDVRVKRLSFEDRLRKAEPVALTDFRLTSDGPVRLLGPKPESEPPVKLNLAGAVEPAVKHFDVAVQAAPFAERPTAKVSVEATGIDGDAVTRIAPELVELIDGNPLTDGRFATALEAEANVRRRGPTQIDLSRGLELTFSMTKTALRAGEKGPVLAGVGLVRGEQVKIDVRSGDVTARTLEVNDLVANAWREKSGIYVLGMRVKGTEVKEAGDKVVTDTQATLASAASAEAPANAAKPQAATDETKPEVRIDRLMVSGIDFRFEDRALDPPVLIPITSLEAEARGLSSLMLEKERPVRFSVALGAGKVSLPKKLHGGALSGALGDLAKLAGGKKVDAAPEIEDRDFFAQIVANGNVKLFPKPSGRAQVSLNGVELAAIRGLASSEGIGLNGGVFDGRVELRTRDDEKLDVRSRFVLTDLSLTEPANGPIVRYLGLPAPLDVVIAAVEAPDQSITLPLHFQVDGATPKGIGPAAVGAVSQVLLTAVASTPVKAVTGVVGLFGDVHKETEIVQEPPVYLEFPPGVTALDPSSQAKLASILGRARRDKSVRVVIEHELGSADLAVAAKRANPPAQQVAVLADNVRSRRRDLLQRRADLLGPARVAAAQGAARGGTAGAGSAQLAEYRQVQDELAAVEGALDRLYDLQRPGAERQTDRRTRAAALELADARLAGARATAQSLLDPAAAERVRVGTSRFVSHGDGKSRLILTVARSVPKGKRPRGG